LPISLETTNTSKSFTVYILVDFGTIGVFINKSFVEKHYLHIHKLSKAVLIYNIDRISAKASQISKVVDVILYYQIRTKQILLIVFSLRKQDLILRFIWLKQHGLKINQQKEEMFMTSGLCQDYEQQALFIFASIFHFHFIFI